MPMSKPVYSAQVATNADVLAEILHLYVPEGSRILDLTYSTGRFWRGAHHTRYDVWTNDLHATGAQYHIDLRDAARHFPPQHFRAVILDPPYVVRHGVVSAAMRRERDDPAAVHKYAEGVAGRRTTQAEWLAGVVGEGDQLYAAGAEQAHALLEDGGVLILKTQDEIRSGRFVPKGLQWLRLSKYRIEDLFVVVQPMAPVWDPKWKRQQHARKNHSYFLVHRRING